MEPITMADIIGRIAVGEIQQIVELFLQPDRKTLVPGIYCSFILWNPP
ncbi:MAG: hypothetical protein P0107_07435 [Nitrosomonas sp.]|nr:hypothetical protein [Nitrosomonas sp.]